MKEGGREGVSEGGREGGREGVKEGGREGGSWTDYFFLLRTRCSRCSRVSSGAQRPERMPWTS